MGKDTARNEQGADGSKPEVAKGGVRKPKELSALPRKKFYRARAHSNPLSDSLMHDVPLDPSHMDWSELLPSHFGPDAPSAQGEGEAPVVRFADVGCGFGGLLIKLSNLYPETLMVGMELRDKVSAYVKERIAALRLEHEGQYTNICCLRANAMKLLPHYFSKGQLTKMFFLFPDPHFKVANHRRRIINTTLITEYAYLMAPGGMLYTITDVKELGEWMRAKLDAHPMFERISDDDLAADPAANVLASATEEGQKVARNGGETFRNVYRRLSAPRVVPLEVAAAAAALDVEGGQ
mmetsp:Transcript_30617/g.67813  ORF Transcript_30617/g.67813 Transcript_30617/m.67813 type:complete len:294 (+) Transcript_30617:69-950(+)